MINGRKSGRSRGRRKICCGAAALASCLPLCLTAAEAGEYSEVSTHQTITEETHNTEKTRFAVTDKEQNRGGALLLKAPYYLAGGSVFAKENINKVQRQNDEEKKHHIVIQSVDKNPQL